MPLKVCQYCGLAYESAMHHDCPQAKIASLSSRIVELEGALEVFAQYATNYAAWRDLERLDLVASGEPNGVRIKAFTVGDLRRAKAALSSPHPRGSDTRDDDNHWPEFNRER